MAGSILVTLAFVLSLFSLIMYYLSFRGAKNTLNYARLAYHGMAMLIIVACAYFLFLILTNQFQYKYIYNYSNDQLPLGFLISTFWAGQEGSFMFWILCTVIVGIFLQSYTAKRGELEPKVMTVFVLTVTFLIAMITPPLKNPFAYLWAEAAFIDLKHINPAHLNLPFIQNFMFTNDSGETNFVKINHEIYTLLANSGISINEFVIHGKGLNPLLQNFWMQLHPPLLFVSWALASVPFAFAIAALLKNDYSDWVRQSFPWTLTATGLQTIGIMTGGYWAYGVLGWGGYWAWDPVENSSLVPWLIGVAAIHTMLVQRHSQEKGGTGRFAKTNLILCILVFITVLYSTFLTRSGVLGDASVHSFVSPGALVYITLLVFIISFLSLGIGMIAYRWKSLNQFVVKDENLLSRELALFTSAVVVGASALIVLVGTSAPIFGQSVEIKFYDEMHIPIAIIVGILNGLSLLLKWNETKGSEILSKSRNSLIATGIFAVILIVFGKVYDIMMILLATSAAFSLFVNVEIGYRVVRGNKIKIGSYIAHIGIALFILGVVGSAGYSATKEIDLVKGEKQEAFGYSMVFTGFEPIQGGAKYAFNIDVEYGNKKYNVRPVMYISEFNNSLMREPDILQGWFKDFYVAPLGYEDGRAGEENHSHGQEVTLEVGKQVEALGAKITYVEFIRPDMEIMMAGGEFSMGAKLKIEFGGKSYDIDAITKRDGEGLLSVPVELKEANLKIELANIDMTSKNAVLILNNITGAEDVHATRSAEVLSITAAIKPFINLVWLGIIVISLGFFLSAYRRLRESWN